MKRILLDLDSYGGTDPLGMFPLFLKKTAEVLASRLTVVLRRLLRLGSFPVCWRGAYVTPIPKGPPSYSASNHRPISSSISASISASKHRPTPILSKVFEHLVSLRLWRFMEGRGVLQTTQVAIGNILALVMLSFVWHTPYRVLWRWGRRLE